MNILSIITGTNTALYGSTKICPGLAFLNLIDKDFDLSPGLPQPSAPIIPGSTNVIMSTILRFFKFSCNKLLKIGDTDYEKFKKKLNKYS